MGVRRTHCKSKPGLVCRGLQDDGSVTDQKQVAAAGPCPGRHTSLSDVSTGELTLKPDRLWPGA
jgi:hypothetical protein